MEKPLNISLWTKRFENQDLETRHNQNQNLGPRGLCRRCCSKWPMIQWSNDPMIIGKFQKAIRDNVQGIRHWSQKDNHGLDEKTEVKTNYSRMKWEHYYQTWHIGHQVFNCTQSHDMTPKKVQNHDLGPLIQGRWEGTFTRGGPAKTMVCLCL